MRVLHSGSLFFGDRHDDFYELLAYLEPGLCLDVGAAAGKATARWLRTNPALRIIAFEPFEGNLPHFRRNTHGLDQVRLVKKAVADFDGLGKLFVASTLSGSEKNWEAYGGYSSSGMLIPETDRRWNDARSSIVETCRLDSVVSEPVRLIKIDVQGGEGAVLEGARALFDRHGVDMVYVEFSGESEILEFLYSRGYVLFDANYTYTPSSNSPDPDDLGDFHQSKVSSGRSVYRGVVSGRPLSADGVMSMWRGMGRTQMQTDLVAVRNAYLPNFLRAAAQRLEHLA